MSVKYCVVCDKDVTQSCTYSGCPMETITKKMQDFTKMTREEAICKTSRHLVEDLEVLGLLKFEQVKKKENITCLFSMNSILGMIRLEEWETGLVLWVGGLIVWQSWKDEAPKKVQVLIEIGKFTRIEMASGSFYQGILARINQD